MNIKDKILQLSGLRYVPYLTAGFITFLLAAGSFYSGFVSYKAKLQDERVSAMGSLGIIRANIEGALNSRLLLGQGLVSYFSVRPGLTAEEFRLYSGKLVKSDPMIRNISVIKDTTIIYAYPIESNRSAIGVDLAKIPVQREQILKVKETGKTAVISNVKLVQGGIATICRMPVITGTRNVPHYWGQISIVLMQEVLFGEAGLHDISTGIKCFLEGIAEDGSSGGALYGDPEIPGQNPVVLDVHFPYGAWRLYAVPAKGWGYSGSKPLLYALFLSALSLILGWLVFWIMTLGRRVQQLESLLPVCSNCGKIRDDNGDWQAPRKYFSEKSSVKVTHSICPECTENLYGDQPWFKKKT